MLADVITVTDLKENIIKPKGTKEEEKMEEPKEISSKRAMLDMKLSTFELPPSGDVLVLAKRCPLGPEAAKRMLDSVAPGQFELVKIENDIVEAIFCRKYLFLRVERELLIKAIFDESKAIMGPQCMITGKCEIVVTVKREL